MVRDVPGDRLFRLSLGPRHDPAVDDWLSNRPGPSGALARHWFGVIRTVGDDVRELVHDGCPVACVDDAPFASVNVFVAHVGVGFFHGAALTDPARLLQGTGKRMRHVKLRPGQAVDVVALHALIDAAHADIRLRLGR